MSSPILYIRGWAPGLGWGEVGRSPREHLSRRTAGGQDQGLSLLVEAAMQLGRGPDWAAVKWPLALLQAEPQKFCWLSGPSRGSS